MSNSVKKWLENEEVPTDGFPIRRVASPESFLGPLPIQSFKRTPNRRTSTSSSASGSRYGSASDASSRQSSVSTAASTAPSVHAQIPGFAAPLPAAEYYLPCDFAFMECFVQFLPSKLDFQTRHQFCLLSRRWDMAQCSVNIVDAIWKCVDDHILTLRP